MNRRQIIEHRRQARSGLGGGGPATPPDPLLVLDRVSVSANHAMSHSHLLRSAYAGSLIRVRRASDNAEADIGHTGGVLNVAALAAHCGVSDGFIVTVYDQTTNARDKTQATTAAQPKIYDGATGILLLSSLPCALHTPTGGAAGQGQWWQRGDRSGFNGAPDITIATGARWDSVATNDRVVTGIGTGGSGAAIATGVTTIGRLSTSATNNSLSAGSRREFTAGVAASTFHTQISTIPLGALSSAGKRQNETDLTAAVTSGSVTALSGNANAWGANCGGGLGLAGYTSFDIAWPSVLTGGDLTALDTFCAAMRTLAGV